MSSSTDRPSGATPAAPATAPPTPAAPATAPDGRLLPAATAMDAVTLRVGDLAATTAFYRDAVALEVLSERGGSVELGRAGRPLVVLEHTPRLPVPGPRQAGLFHTAILFEDTAGLAGALASVARTAPGSYAGSADHLVSEAFYLTDPEGNGVELYADRPRETWARDGASIRMASLPLDPHRFLEEHLTSGGAERPAADPAVVGHVHLQVGDVATARAFYVDVLGFEITAEIGDSALFVAAGGYHHHMAMNTWNSRGAGPRAAALGLGRVTLTVPGQDDVAALAERLRAHRVGADHDGRSLAFDDPWGSRVTVTAA